MLAKELDRRRARFAQEVERTRQHHRHTPRFRECRDPRFARILEVVRGEGLESRGELGAARIRELVRVQLHAQAVALRRFEHPPHLIPREGDRLAEPVDGGGKPLGRRARDHPLAHLLDVLVGAALELRRDGVRAQEGRRDRHGVIGREAARDPQAAQLVVDIEPVARLDLHSRDSF